MCSEIGFLLRNASLYPLRDLVVERFEQFYASRVGSLSGEIHIVPMRDPLEPVARHCIESSRQIRWPHAWRPSSRFTSKPDDASWLAEIDLTVPSGKRRRER